jgi:hypothetical protein
MKFVPMEAGKRVSCWLGSDVFLQGVCLLGASTQKCEIVPMVLSEFFALMSKYFTFCKIIE